MMKRHGGETMEVCFGKGDLVGCMNWYHSIFRILMTIEYEYAAKITGVVHEEALIGRECDTFPAV